MRTVEEVANWFLSKQSMSPKKLQKILYYSYAWYLTLSNEDSKNLQNKLFNENFEAWVHGPVIASVYQEYRKYGYNDIPLYEGELPKFDSETLDVLEQVWEVYGKYNGNELESITHQESPWINARKGYSPLDRCIETISDEDIFKCYIERIQ